MGSALRLLLATTLLLATAACDGDGGSSVCEIFQDPDRNCLTPITLGDCPQPAPGDCETRMDWSTGSSETQYGNGLVSTSTCTDESQTSTACEVVMVANGAECNRYTSRSSSSGTQATNEYRQGDQVVTITFDGTNIIYTCPDGTEFHMTMEELEQCTESMGGLDEVLCDYTCDTDEHCSYFQTCQGGYCVDE